MSVRVPKGTVPASIRGRCTCVRARNGRTVIAQCALCREWERMMERKRIGKFLHGYVERAVAYYEAKRGKKGSRINASRRGRDVSGTFLCVGSNYRRDGE